MARHIGKRVVTMADIARVTGLSKMTVSRVLNKHPHVSEATRRKVEAAVRTLGFQPNTLAKRFFTGKTHLLGVVAPLDYMFRSWYFKDLFEGLFERCEQSGYDILLQNSLSPHKPLLDKCLEWTKGRLVEGLLIVAPMTYDVYPVELAQQNIPLVVLGESPVRGKVHSVTATNRTASAEAVQHLIEYGHRKIAVLVYDRTHAESLERETGAREALARAGIKLDPELLLSAQYNRVTAYHRVYELFQRRSDVTAIFALNADMALGAVDAVRALKLSVPDQVSIIAFDDVPEMKELTPPLTAVRQNAFEVAYKGCDLLLQIVNESIHPAKPQTVYVPATLIQRNSVGRARIS